MTATDNPVQPGTRIRVVASEDAAIEPGDTGTIEHADTVQGGRMVVVAWDSDALALIDPALVEAFGDRWVTA